MRTARATIKGFEVMRMFKKGRFRLWIEPVGGSTEASFINLFGNCAWAGHEVEPSRAHSQSLHSPLQPLADSCEVPRPVLVTC